MLNPPPHATETRLLQGDKAGIARAAALLRGGHLVAIPTETVYGLAGDAGNDRAVAAIFAAKDRPRFNPLIVHLASLAQAERLARLNRPARVLAERFWPGPLTLVLPLRADAGLSPLVTAGLGTVALRLPAHPLARALLKRAGIALAAPSANRSGRISPTRPEHVLAGLGGRIAAVLDGGACAVGLESTIIDATGAQPRLLRAGGLTTETIESALGAPLASPDTPAGNTPSAPGQLESHYAPRGRVRLMARQRRPGEVWIGFGPDCPGSDGLNLSPGADLTEAAANLFHILHRADARAGEDGTIAIAPIPDTGLGRAINDRLCRAAAPR
ncbi:MAG: threonylcarbamoyl-AMP synthase [Pararhodobacter sp.]|nr:threonylcarbamoyl-AMP synthase [Pararhodobacter sp.]